jgi:hypothetical protein
MARSKAATPSLHIRRNDEMASLPPSLATTGKGFLNSV